MIDRRLEWVGKNRVRRDRTRRAGELVGAVVASGRRPDGELIAQAVKALSVCVDDEFRRHCRVAELRGGLLRLHVDAPSMVSTLRGRWRSSICAALKSARPAVAFRDVVFVYGREGASIGDLGAFSSSNVHAG